MALDADAVTAGRAEALVSGYDTTYSIDCKDDAGNRVTGSPTYVEKGNMVALAHETLGSGCKCIVAGTVFISDLEVKAGAGQYLGSPILKPHDCRKYFRRSESGASAVYDCGSA